LRFRSHPFDVHWPCRAVRGLPTARTIPLRRWLRRTTPKPSPASPLRFSCLASPLCESVSGYRAPFSRVGGDAARAGHSWLVFFGQRTYRARARACSRGLAGGGFPSPATSVGFADPFAVLLRPSRVDVPLRSRPDPPAVWPRAWPRVSSIAGSGFEVGSWAVGFGFWVLAPRASLRATRPSLPL